MTGRRRLAMYLVPIVGVMVAGLVTRAVWPSLLESAPWALLVLTSTVSRLLLVQPLVPASVFFVVTIARICVLAPVYYGFGRDYGDAALHWTEERMGASASFVRRVEHWFRRFSRILVVCWWSVFVCMLAGTTRMRARVFFPLVALGAVLRVSVIFFVGDWLSKPLTAIAQFVGRYALILTPITIGITALQLWYTRRRGRAIRLGSVDELERDFATAEAEVAAEATVWSAPEPD